jgi:hypothetical protein
MNSQTVTKLLSVFGLALAAQTSLQAQHGHLNAGAAGKSQGDPLIFANGADFTASSGYVKTLTYTNAATYAGYYQGNITLTALPTTAANAGPDPAASAPGSFIRFTLSRVEGPEGGAFGFWDVGAAAPSIQIASGGTSTNLWGLSESDGTTGADPFGHIHGRRFTATKPGIYKVSFQLFDTSTNGLNGAPIHSPSQSLAVFFEAGVNLQSIEPDEDHTHVRFAAPAGSVWQVEASPSLDPQSWRAVGDVIAGDDLFHLVADETPVRGNRFYRLKAVGP